MAANMRVITALAEAVFSFIRHEKKAINQINQLSPSVGSCGWSVIALRQIKLILPVISFSYSPESGFIVGNTSLQRIALLSYL